MRNIIDKVILFIQVMGLYLIGMLPNVLALDNKYKALLIERDNLIRLAVNAEKDRLEAIEKVQTWPSALTHCPVTRFPHCKNVKHWEQDVYIPIYGGPNYAYTIPFVSASDEFVSRAYSLEHDVWQRDILKTGLFLVRTDSNTVKH